MPAVRSRARTRTRRRSPTGTSTAPRPSHHRRLATCPGRRTRTTCTSGSSGRAPLPGRAERPVGVGHGPVGLATGDDRDLPVHAGLLRQGEDGARRYRRSQAEGRPTRRSPSGHRRQASSTSSERVVLGWTLHADVQEGLTRAGPRSWRRSTVSGVWP
jgi:hypothetical protein